MLPAMLNCSYCQQQDRSGWSSGSDTVILPSFTEPILSEINQFGKGGDFRCRDSGRRHQQFGRSAGAFACSAAAITAGLAAGTGIGGVVSQNASTAVAFVAAGVLSLARALSGAAAS